MLYDFFKEAREQFFRNELENILSGVSERNLCGRLAIYYSSLRHKYGLQDYFADPEYNRKQKGLVKTILDENAEVVAVNCDLILHSRGNRKVDDNLIALEMKKAYQDYEEKESDRKRLRTLTKESYDGVWSADGQTHPEHVCNYHLGVYFEIDPKRRTYLNEYYEKGEMVESEQGNF